MDSSVLNRLIEELSKLPGIGPKSAERIAFYLLKASTEYVEGLVSAIVDLKRKLRYCKRCFNLTDADVCKICSNPRRDSSVVCVVEEPKDVVFIEQVGVYDGVYHVLLGHLSPMDGVEPEDLTIPQLKERLKGGGIREVILATNPTVEGDGTALYISDMVKKEFPNVKVTRLARGLSVGSCLEFTSKATLVSAISERKEV